jgi:hypothetical protein
MLVRANTRCFVGNPPQYREGNDPDDWFEYDGPPASYLDPKGGQWPGGVVPKHVAGIRDGLFGGKGDHDNDGKAGGDKGRKTKHPNIVHSEADTVPLGGGVAEAVEQVSDPGSAAKALPANFETLNFFRQKKIIRELTGVYPKTKQDVADAAAKLKGI